MTSKDQIRACEHLETVTATDLSGRTVTGFVPPEPVAKPSMSENRVQPFPAGHDATWGAMMPGMSWKEAQAMTSHMGRL